MPEQERLACEPANSQPCPIKAKARVLQFRLAPVTILLNTTHWHTPKQSNRIQSPGADKLSLAVARHPVLKLGMRHTPTCE